MDTQAQEAFQDELADYMIAGGTLHALYGVTQEELEALYTRGFQQYSIGQYEKAMEDFAFLVTLKGDEKRYLFAFAAVLQVLKDYKRALFFYSRAAAQDMFDPIVTFHMVECLVALDMKSDALVMLRILLKETAKDAQWATLHTKAVAYRSLLAHAEPEDTEPEEA